MTALNTTTTYGSVARVLHWLTALLILTALPLGLVANNLSYDTSDALALKAQVFSLHKTVGVAAFAVALVRILWAITQPHPTPVNPERRREVLVAGVVHWMLYLSLLLVPLSGWVHHAATAGFAPILWPLGQGLPLVPLSEAVAAGAAALHWLFTKVLALSIALHVLGALKHGLIDRDGTLSRMWRGSAAGRPGGARAGVAAPVIAALLYAGGAWAALALIAPPPAPAAVMAPQTAGGNWTVEEGRIAFTVTQLGAPVAARFDDWTAAIVFDDVAKDGVHGSVRVEIAVGSGQVGSVTAQALGPDFLDAAAAPVAVFEAVLRAAPEGYVADGTLSLRGVRVPVSLPFTLMRDGDRATMAGRVALDRRDFGIGQSYANEATVGFGVTVDVTVTATRQ